MSTHNIYLRSAAKTAGISSIIMFFAAMIAELYARQGLIIPHDANATAHNIINNSLMFRIGISGFLTVLICDILVSWALFLFFTPVHKNISLLAALFRLVYTAIFGAALVNLVVGFRLLLNTDSSTIETVSDQALLYFNTFSDSWSIGLVFFSIHLLLIAYLVLRSGGIPKILGILLATVSIAYLTDNLAKLFLGNYEYYQTLLTIFVAVPSIIGEVGFALWLLIKGKHPNP